MPRVEQAASEPVQPAGDVAYPRKPPHVGSLAAERTMIPENQKTRTISNSLAAATPHAESGSPLKYAHEERGLNSRLDELQAALLRARLARLDDWNGRRSQVAASYSRLFAGRPGLELPVPPPGTIPAWHLYVVRHRHRDRLRAGLERRGIGTLVHYPRPPHRTPAYADLGIAPGSLPESERLAEQVMSLPMGPHLCAEQVERVTAAVVETLSEIEIGRRTAAGV